jgi:glycerol-3-phosphate acyltransferase PlsX
MQRSMFSRLGYLLAKPGFGVLRQKMDPRAVNGGVFLGLNGVVVKSHGGTDAVGFANAIGVAVDMIARDLNTKIGEELEHIGSAVAPVAQAASE